jgi:NADPH-dependent curcumin reductase CurA
MAKNIQVLLASRPTGPVEESNFNIVETDLPKPGGGEILVKNYWLSLDPYMRGRMNAVKSYAKYVEIGEVMTGGTVGQVAESSNPKFKVGDHVSWNSEAGRVRGKIVKVHRRAVNYKGHVHRATPDEPQYEIKSDKTDHVALHKAAVLRLLG